MSKFVILSIILSFLIFKGLGNDDLFAKFHQSAYKLKNLRMECKWYNTSYYNFYEVKTFKHNRSVPAVNASLNTKVDVDGQQIELLIQVYKFASNEYRIFPIRMQINLWKALNANIAGLAVVFKCGNIPLKTFFFKKGVTYSVCNVILDPEHLPPLIPVGLYMVQSILFLGSHELVEVDVFFEIYHEMAVPN